MKTNNYKYFKYINWVIYCFRTIDEKTYEIFQDGKWVELSKLAVIYPSPVSKQHFGWKELTEKEVFMKLL